MQVDFKTVAKNLKDSWAERKNLKNKAFCTPYENFARHAKNQKSLHKGCENFAHPANTTLHTLQTLLHTPCENFAGMRRIRTPNTMRNAMRKYQRGFANLLGEKAVRNYKGCTNPFRTPKLVVRIPRGCAKTKSHLAPI